MSPLGAWALQCLSCYLLLVALGLGHQVGIAGAAGVLFAVNITAVLLCEIYGARDGIGYRIAAWGENLQMPQLYAALVIVAAAAVAVNEALRAVEARLGAWRQRT